MTSLHLTKAEAWGDAFDIDQVAGASADVLYVLRPDDTDDYHRVAVYGPVQRLELTQQTGLDVAVKRYAFIQRL